MANTNEVLHPNPPSSSVLVQIAPAKDVATKMVVKALVGTTASSNSYHVFEQVKSPSLIRIVFLSLFSCLLSMIESESFLATRARTIISSPCESSKLFLLLHFALQFETESFFLG